MCSFGLVYSESPYNVFSKDHGRVTVLMSSIYSRLHHRDYSEQVLAGNSVDGDLQLCWPYICSLFFNATISSLCEFIKMMSIFSVWENILPLFINASSAHSCKHLEEIHMKWNNLWISSCCVCPVFKILTCVFVYNNHSWLLSPIFLYQGHCCSECSGVIKWLCKIRRLWIIPIYGRQYLL